MTYDRYERTRKRVRAVCKVLGIQRVWDPVFLISHYDRYYRLRNIWARIHPIQSPWSLISLQSDPSRWAQRCRLLTWPMNHHFGCTDASDTDRSSYISRTIFLHPNDAYSHSRHLSWTSDHRTSSWCGDISREVYRKDGRDKSHREKYTLRRHCSIDVLSGSTLGVYHSSRRICTPRSISIMREWSHEASEQEYFWNTISSRNLGRKWGKDLQEFSGNMCVIVLVFSLFLI